MEKKFKMKGFRVIERNCLRCGKGNYVTAHNTGLRFSLPFSNIYRMSKNKKSHVEIFKDTKHGKLLFAFLKNKTKNSFELRGVSSSPKFPITVCSLALLRENNLKDKQFILEEIKKDVWLGKFNKIMGK